MLWFKYFLSQTTNIIFKNHLKIEIYPCLHLCSGPQYPLLEEKFLSKTFSAVLLNTTILRFCSVSIVF